MREGVAQRALLGAGPTLCVGKRAATSIARRGVTPTKSYPAPASAEGIAHLLGALAEDVFSLFVDEHLASFWLVGTSFLGVGKMQVEVTRLLPFAQEPNTQAIETRYVSRQALASVAARELLYITLYDALLESMSCEHSARLLATQSAETWIDARLDRIRRQLLSSKRESSTQEVIEIVVGARGRRHAERDEKRE